VLIFKKSTFALAAMVAVPMFAASTPAMAAGCTLATLTGTYTYAYLGYNVVKGVDVPFSVAGFASYDGKGGLKGTETETTTSATGKVVVSPGTYTGTYTITAKCAIKEIDTQAGVLSHYDEFTGPSGNTINFVQTDQGVVSSAIETRD